MMRFFFGHHRCASTYLDNVILRRVCKRMPLKRDVLFSPEQFDCRLDRFVRSNDFGFISYVNADRKFIDQLDMSFRGVHVIRDPRDVVVSAYFAHLHSHSTVGWPELVEFRKTLSRLNKKEGLLAELEFIADLPTNGYNLRPFRCMMEWSYSDHQILELKFEDMASDPHAFFMRIGRHLKLTGTPVSVFTSKVKSKMWSTPRQLKDHELLDVVARNSFAKLAGRGLGNENSKHHYRKGEPGDWRRQFDEDITREFKQKFPGLLCRLGYESGDDW